MHERLFFAEIVGMPRLPDYGKLISAMLNSQFMLCHELKNSRTLVITEEMNALARVKSAVTGMDFAYTTPIQPDFRNPVQLIVYNEIPDPRNKEEIAQCLSEVYTLFGGSDANIFISFSPSSPEQLKRVMKRTEEMLSRKETRLSRNIGSSPGSSGSMHMDVYHESHERRLLLSMLEMFDEIMMGNGLSYSVSILVDTQDRDLLKYIKSRISVIDELKPRIGSVESLYGQMRKAEAIPLSYKHAANLLSFSSRARMNEVLDTRYHGSSGEVLLGNYLEGGIVENGRSILTDPSAFNLGTIITGVPGTGKTTIAMSLISQLLGRSRPAAVIISPTAEWDGFGIENGMAVVRVYEDDTPMNFFKCDSEINIERFYENLAVLLAAASSAGPYRNSMEKCLLSAFHKVYSNTRSPDPTEVYREIEKAVIEQHGKRTNTDVTFTKHGENVMAALQHLRLMLMKAQFAYSEGIDFNELLKKGAVFDLSNVSSGIKPFFYALILNQSYAMCESLDLNGDNELRLVICLEEAQLVFANSDESAATIDLKQKIQDFRKRGVGLILLTHSITDVNIGIRRLCQTKVYFRQSADVAKYASSDLSFNAAYEDLVIEKLKRLDHGVSALSFVQVIGNGKSLEDSVFAKMQRYEVSTSYQPRVSEGSCQEAEMKLTIQNVNDEPRRGVRIELIYVGEKVYEGATDGNGIVKINGLLKGKKYKLRVLGEKRRDARIFEIVAGEEVLVKA